MLTALPAVAVVALLVVLERWHYHRLRRRFEDRKRAHNAAVAHARAHGLPPVPPMNASSRFGSYLAKENER